MGPLFILSMVRRSTLPKRIDQAIGNWSALEGHRLRQFGSTVQVRVSSCGQLDVVDSTSVTTQRQPQSFRMHSLLPDMTDSSLPLPDIDNDWTPTHGIKTESISTDTVAMKA